MTAATATAARARYLPEPDSAAHRMCVWAADNPGESLTARDVAIKFGLSSTQAVRPLLERAVAARLLAIEQLAGLTHYQAGAEIHRLPVPRQSKTGLELQRAMSPTPAPAPAPAVDADPPARPKSKRGGARQRLPHLDVMSIAIEHDVPMPPRRGGTKGESYWHGLFRRLDRAGACTAAIDLVYRDSCNKIIGLWHKANLDQQLVARAVSDQQFRVWRVK